MKTIKITYWTTTSLLALLSTASGWAYLTQAQMQQSFLHLGFPDYFRVELALAKLGGGQYWADLGVAGRVRLKPLPKMAALSEAFKAEGSGKQTV